MSKIESPHKSKNKLLIIPLIAMLVIVSFTGFSYATQKQNQLHASALAEVTSSVNAQVQELQRQGKSCSVIYGHNLDPVVVVIECDAGNGVTQTITDTFTVTSNETLTTTLTGNATQTITQNTTQTFTNIVNSTNVINSTNIVNSTNTVNSTQTIPTTTTVTIPVNSTTTVTETVTSQDGTTTFTTTIPVNSTSTFNSTQTSFTTISTTITQTCTDFGNGTIICH